MDVLQLHEQERDAVDEAHNIGATSVQRSLYPELAHYEEVVVLCIVEVKYTQRSGFHVPMRVSVCHLNAVA